MMFGFYYYLLFKYHLIGAHFHIVPVIISLIFYDYFRRLRTMSRVTDIKL